MLERKGELGEVNSRNLQMAITELEDACEESTQSWADTNQNDRGKA